MKIYIASSWRNKARVNELDDKLSRAGHTTFNFTRPGQRTTLPNGFHWSYIDADWQSWDAKQYRELLKHPIAEDGFHQDFNAMKWADACVAVQPFGRSASLEVGWFCGAGKPAIIVLSHGEPELMVKMAHLCLSDEEAIKLLDRLP